MDSPEEAATALEKFVSAKYGAELSRPYTEVYALRSLESRYTQSLVNKGADFLALADALRGLYRTSGEEEIADKLIHFVLEGRKYFGQQEDAMRGHSAQGSESSSNSDYRATPNRIGRPISSALYYQQAAHPIERRIPRPGDKGSQSIPKGVELSKRTPQTTPQFTPQFTPQYTPQPTEIQSLDGIHMNNGFSAKLSRTPLMERSTSSMSVEVATRTLVMEILHAMKGLGGNIIRPDGGQLVLSPSINLDPGKLTAANEFITLGNLCNQLPLHPSDDRAIDLFKKAFHRGMFLERSKYLHAVDCLINQIADISDEAVFYHIEEFSFEWLRKLRVLVNLWIKLKGNDRPGCEIIDDLLELHWTCPDAYPKEECCKALLEELTPLYVDLLVQWILNGTLHEYSGRWLIKAYKSSTQGNMDIMGTYRLDKTPSRFRFFYDSRLAHKILEVGRLITCLGGPEWTGWDEVLKKTSTITADHFIDINNNYLATQIQEIYLDASRDVKKTLVERDRLFDHLAIISEVYFFMDERFSRRLFLEVEKVSVGFTKTVSAAEAAIMIAKAAAASGIIQLNKRGRSSHFEVIAEVGSTPRESIRRNYINSFHITYIAATGLASCVLSRDALLRYQNIFHIMWSIQFVYQGILYVRTLHSNLTTTLRRIRIKDFDPLLHSWSRVLAHVGSVVHTIAHYASDLCEYRKHYVFGRLETAIDLTDCISQHDKHLKAIEDGLFLDSKFGTPVANCLGPLFDESISTFQYYERFKADLNGHLLKWDLNLMDLNPECDSFVQMERAIDVEVIKQEMLELQKQHMVQLAHIYAKFKNAEKNLYESLIPFGDILPMSRLKDLLSFDF